MAILCGDDMKYAWTDLETTGLDPKKGDILEVYVRVTDTDRSRGENIQDTLFIDQMYFLSES